MTSSRFRLHALVTLLLMGIPVADVFEAPVWTARAPSRGSARGLLILISFTSHFFCSGFPRDRKRFD